MKTFLFVISIFVSVLFVSVNVSKLIQSDRIPSGNFIWMAVALTAVITHIMGMW